MTSRNHDASEGASAAKDGLSPERRGWFWAIAFFLFAAVHITDGLRDPVDRAIHLMSGVGMLLLIPQAFLYPKEFASRRLWPTNLTGWMVVLGIFLVAISFAARLLDF